ncbi:MAG: NAD(P)H-dependent oxidoreductase [Candidatus Micrarchaeia archaeon]
MPEDVSSKLIEGLNWRYATKAFDPLKKVSDADIAALLESMRLAPSSFGLQPWKFMVISEQGLKDRLMAASWNQQQVGQAPYVIAICVPREITKGHISSYMACIEKAQPAASEQERQKQKERLAGFQKRIEGFLSAMPPEARTAWARMQAYIAMGFLLYTCAQMRIDSCPMEGFEREKAEEVLGLSKLGLELVAIVPVGYRSASDSHALAKKARFGTGEVIIRP